jgi:hypothetical protein
MRTKSTRVSPSRLPTFSASTAESLSSGCEYSSRQSSLRETQLGVNKSSQIKHTEPALVVVLQRQAMHRSGQHQQGAPVLARLRFQLQPAGDPRRQHLLLWCVWELYTFFSTSGTSALKRVELYDFSDAGTSTLLEFDVANAHCFSPVDETKLRSIIESGGASNFNDMIREGACEESAVCFWFS